METKKHIANTILEGITSINIEFPKDFKSKNFELLPVIQFLDKLKVKDLSLNTIEELLTDEEVRRFAKIQFLKEKVHLCLLNKSSPDT